MFDYAGIGQEGAVKLAAIQPFRSGGLKVFLVALTNSLITYAFLCLVIYADQQVEADGSADPLGVVVGIALIMFLIYGYFSIRWVVKYISRNLIRYYVVFSVKQPDDLVLDCNVFRRREDANKYATKAAAALVVRFDEKSESSIPVWINGEWRYPWTARLASFMSTNANFWLRIRLMDFEGNSEKMSPLEAITFLNQWKDLPNYTAIREQLSEQLEEHVTLTATSLIATIGKIDRSSRLGQSKEGKSLRAILVIYLGELIPRHNKERKEFEQKEAIRVQAVTTV